MAVNFLKERRNLIPPFFLSGISIILPFIFCLLNFVSYSQSKRDIYIEDSIMYNINKIDLKVEEYHSLKKNILNLEKVYKSYEPEYKYVLINKSYQFGDIFFFKKELSVLVKKYGFKIDYLTEKELYFNDIMHGSLSKWFKKMYLKNHFVWLRDNFHKQIDLKKLNELKLKDQLVNSMAAKTSLINGLTSQQKEENLKNLSEYFYKNSLELYEISQKCDCLPNGKSFSLIQNDYGVVEIHNLQSKWNFEKYFELMFEYYKKAYLKNEISFIHFKNFDNLFFLHKGFQKFGLIKKEEIPKELNIDNLEIPIIDKVFSEKIKKEFKWY